MPNDIDSVFLMRKNRVDLNSTLQTNFGIVQQHGKDCEYEACFSCNKIYTFKKTMGINTMNNHKCIQFESRDSQAMSLFATKCISTTHENKKMRLAIANFCAIDLRSFEYLARHGLKELLQTTLDIGVASNKRLMVDALLFQPVTAKRNIETRAMKGRDIVAKTFKKHIDTDVFMTRIIDLWTENIKNVTNIYVTEHHIDEEFALFD